MTKQNDPGPEKKLVFSLLPWLTAAAALTLYLLTMNRWVSFNNLSQVARSSGWTWGAELNSPLYYALTYPARWLPAPWVPLALNLFILLCAVLTLALLARSVVLLPHDRTEAQRQREPSKWGLSLRAAWMPPVLAVVVCGLGLTFWEGATSGSSELLDLLLLAYVSRCLLEYRVHQRDSWLLRGIFVCGLGMANSWLMFCLCPLFIVSLVWIKGLAFFDFRFLFKLFLCGTAGLLLYLLLPLLYVLSPDPMGNFWQALKVNLAMDKAMFMAFVKRVPANVLLLLSMTSFLPILVIGIRWATNFGDPSRMGSLAANWIFHITHGALLGVCVWAAFDPMFSPRHIIQSTPILRDYFTALIPALYYLGALSVGYLSGYFLLSFKPIPDHMGRISSLQSWMHRLAQATVWILFFLVPAGLIVKNISAIRMSNGPAMKEYAALLVRTLPDSAVVLADPDDARGTARKLYLAASLLARDGKATNYTFLETLLLKVPAYHALQQKRRRGEWPLVVNAKSTEAVDDLTRAGLLEQLSKKQPVFYLHPSFGAFFEFFYLEPHGLTLTLKLCPTNSLGAPPLTESAIAENEEFWNAGAEAMQQLIPFIARNPGARPGFRQALMDRLHIPFEPNATAVTLGIFYSLSLDFWGVQLQRAGKLIEAERHFETALALNSENIAAKSNLELNRLLQAGRRPAFRVPTVLAEQLGKYRDLQQALRITGPFDDPSQCFGQAIQFRIGNNLRQAGQQLERIHELVPDNLQVSLSLAQLYIVNRLPEKALDLLDGLNAQPEDLVNAGIVPQDLLQAKATALYRASRESEADQLLQAAMQKDPTDQNLLVRVVQMSAMFGRYTNALIAIDRQLQIKADDPAVLLAKGLFNIQMCHFQDAIPPLTQAIDLQTNNFNAQLYRAVAYLNCNRLDEAQQDFEFLQKSFPKAIDVNNGLGEIAMRRHDTNTAIRFFEICLADANPGSDQARFFTERLRNLKSPAVGMTTNIPPQKP